MVTKINTIKTNYITTREVAEMCDVSISTVYYWIKVKELFTVLTKGSRYFVKKSDVKKFLKNGGIGPYSG